MNVPIRILFLAANPSSSTRLALDEEFRDIESKLRASEYRDRFQTSVSLAVRPEDLHQVLLERKPTIVHFSGHGAGSPGLVFAGDSLMEEKLVTADALRHLFSVLRDNVRVVVLNACFSNVQASSIVSEIDFVVGMGDSIGDKAAQVFAASFYRGLGFGRSVKASFELGINALKLEGLTHDEVVPILLERPGATPAQDTVLVGAEAVAVHRHDANALVLDVGNVHHANEASPDAAVHFTITCASASIKVSEIHINVLRTERLTELMAHVPAAPVTERCLFGRLSSAETGNILPTPHVVHQGETDGFLAKLQGDEGNRYLVTIEISWKHLGQDAHTKTVSSPVELAFPVRTAAGMLSTAPRRRVSRDHAARARESSTLAMIFANEVFVHRNG